ncbi:Uncharacterised protein [Mycobacteroides abscessus subsp. abscessus]|nr:Uncharacterised protein [Mycobacteroides abscessus subsp. abscessus]
MGTVPGVCQVNLVENHEIRQVQVLSDLRVPDGDVLVLSGVHDGDQSPVTDAPVLGRRREHHAYQGQRLGQSAGLDDDRVDIPAGKSGQHAAQFVIIGATAQASIGHGHGRVDLARNQHGIDVDGTEVVDYHADSHAQGVAQQIVQQCRLTGTQESGDDGDRDQAMFSTLLRTRPSLGKAVN